MPRGDMSSLGNQTAPVLEIWLSTLWKIWVLDRFPFNSLTLLSSLALLKADRR